MSIGDCGKSRRASKRLEERDQRVLVVQTQAEAVGMAFDCVGRCIMRLEPGRNVIVAEPPRIEPVFEGRAPPAVAEHTPVPDAFKRGHFVVARSTTRL